MRQERKGQEHHDVVKERKRESFRHGHRSNKDVRDNILKFYGAVHLVTATFV